MLGTFYLGQAYLAQGPPLTVVPKNPVVSIAGDIPAVWAVAFDAE